MFNGFISAWTDGRSARLECGFPRLSCQLSFSISLIGWRLVRVPVGVLPGEIESPQLTLFARLGGLFPRGTDGCLFKLGCLLWVSPVMGRQFSSRRSIEVRLSFLNLDLGGTGGGVQAGP